MTPRMLVRIGVGVCLTVAIALWAGSRANAIVINGGKTAHFGMFGIARGQTARINIVNIDNPNIIDDPNTLPPGPCRVRAGFIDADGMMLAERAIIIDGGRSALLDIRYADATDQRPRARIEVRAFVEVQSPDPADRAPGNCVPTVEVFDTNTGLTAVFIDNPNLIDNPNTMPTGPQ